MSAKKKQFVDDDYEEQMAAQIAILACEVPAAVIAEGEYLLLRLIALY